jgi:hypothetical protein
MELFKEIAILPEVMDAAHHESPATHRLALGIMIQGITGSGFVRDLRDGEWLDAAAKSATGSKTASEFLEILKKRKLLLNSTSCKAPNWFREAALSHQQRPLTGIVVDDLTDQKVKEVPFSCISLLQDASWWLEKPPSIDIYRTPEELVRVFRLLLIGARITHIIDPFLNPSEERYKRSIDALFRASLVNPHKPEFFFHTSSKVFATVQEVKKAFEPFSKLLNTHGRRGRVCFWDPAKLAGKFHDRHFVCDIGGCQIGAGFAVSSSEITTISLHSDSTRSNTLKRFNYDKNCAIGLIDAFAIGAIREGGNVAAAAAV